MLLNTSIYILVLIFTLDKCRPYQCVALSLFSLVAMAVQDYQGSDEKFQLEKCNLEGSEHTGWWSRRRQESQGFRTAGLGRGEGTALR